MFRSTSIEIPRMNLAVVQLGVLSVGLALAISIAKLLSQYGLHPLHISLIQVTGSSLILMSLVKPSRAVAKKHWQYFLAASMLGFTLPNIIIIWAANRFGVSVAAVSYALPIVVTYFLSVACSLQTLSVYKVLCIAGAASGTLLVLEGVLSIEPSLSLLVVLLAPLFVGIANIVRGQYWPNGIAALEVALWTNLFSSFSYSLLILVYRPPLSIPGHLVSNTAMLILTLICVSALGQILLFRLQKTTSPAFISQIGSLTALAGCLLGLILFAEPVGWLQLFGCGLTIFSVYHFTRSLTKT